MSRSGAKRTYSEMVKTMLESKGIYIKSLTRDGIVEELRQHTRMLIPLQKFLIILE